MSTQYIVEGAAQGRTGGLPRPPREPGIPWLDAGWPAIVACMSVLGFAFAMTSHAPLPKFNVSETLQKCYAWFRPPAPSPVSEALVVSANRNAQLTFITAIGPRGFHPLLAASETEVLAQIHAYPGALTLAVVDSTIPGFARIALALKRTIPANRIIVLKGSPRPEDIAPLLLDRL